MKNKQRNVGSFAPAKLQVIIAIAMITAIIGFSFAACGEGGGSNSSIVGTWVNDTFTGYEVTIYSNGTLEVKSSGVVQGTGTINTSDNTYSMTMTTSNIFGGVATVSETGTYSISGKKLTMTKDGGTTTTFTKKK